MKKENEETLAVAVEKLNKKIDGLIEEQKEIKKAFNKCLQKLNKMQEFHEINDMRAELFNKEVNDIKRCLIMINDKLY